MAKSDLTLKARIGRAFRKLNAQGYFAKNEYSCCRTCSYDKFSRESHVKPPKGFAFTTTQSFDTLQRRLATHVYFDGNEGETTNTMLPKVDVGKAVVKAFEDEGLAVIWSGDPCESIRVARTPADLGLPHRSNLP